MLRVLSVVDRAWPLHPFACSDVDFADGRDIAACKGPDIGAFIVRNCSGSGRGLHLVALHQRLVEGKSLRNSVALFFWSSFRVASCIAGRDRSIDPPDVLEAVAWVLRPSVCDIFARCFPDETQNESRRCAPWAPASQSPNLSISYASQRAPNSGATSEARCLRSTLRYKKPSGQSMYSKPTACRACPSA